MVKKVEAGEKVASVARQFGISRTLFYRYLKRYQQAQAAKEEPVKALENEAPVPKHFWHLTPPDIEKKVLDIVVQFPELSAHKIVEVLPAVGNKPILSNKGVQNVLRRHNLGIYEQRLAFSAAQEKFAIPAISLAEIPQIPLKLWRLLYAPFVTIPKLVWLISRSYATLILTSLVVLLFFLWLRFILLIPEVSKVGTVFATISLTFGFLFFLYSLKYYLSAILVLTVPHGSKQSTENSQQEEKINGQAGFWSISKFIKIPAVIFNKFLASVTPKTQTTGLVPDLTEVKLEKYPFVSVHIPLYNEKKVAERILTATLAQEYPQDKFEIIVADDSNDGTTEIVRRFETENHPKVKVIHRETREGFKGGALGEALRVCDPGVEYIIIFDADFIPFPDTITQFVKYFKLADEKTAAVQGYQWHVLNKSENWITRGVRAEYAGSYVVERSATEIYSGLKMIAGSVYCIKKSILDQFGWGTSITEDFELTLRLYEKGYKVIYTPYIQTPAEAVSTIKRLIRQRMRWAEGHTYNIKQQAYRLLTTNNLNFKEKLEFTYLAPYYLQAAFFIVGTISWFLAEAVFRTKLPFWTATFGWSLVFTNFLALPLINSLGLFLEEAEKKDYLGILSFVALAYIVTPFQAYAAVKALFEKEEGPWFRTPKTGLITDVISKVRLGFWWRRLFPWGKTTPAILPLRNQYLSLVTANSHFNNFEIRPKKLRWIGKTFTTSILIFSVILINSTGNITVLNSLVKTQEAFGFANTSNNLPKTSQEPISNNENVAVNSTKPNYLLGEQVKIGIGVVDKFGNTVCDAQLNLKIKNEKLKVDEQFSTEEGSIENSSECGAHTVTNTPDYFASFVPNQLGIYTLGVTAKTKTGTYEANTSFVVERLPRFSVEHDGPVRINPDSSYTMKFTIKSVEDFSGYVKELVPGNFEIKAISEGGSLAREIKNGFGIFARGKEIVWRVNFAKDQTYSLSYTFKTPLVSPKVYQIGPFSIGDWQEARSWQVVIDSAVTVFDGTFSDATAYENQRKAFRKPIGDKEYYAFYRSSGAPNQIRYAFSTNGTTWTTEQAAGGNAVKTNANVGVDFKDRNGSTVDVVMNYVDTSDICRYRHGTLTATGDTITWATEVTCGILDKGLRPSIVIDQGDRVWIAMGEDSGNSFKLELGADSTTNPTAPPDDIGGNKVSALVDETASQQKHAEVVPLTTDAVGVIWTSATGTMKAAKATFSAGAITMSSTASFTGTFTEGLFSAVDEPDDSTTAYVLYRNGTSLDERRITFPSGSSGTPTFDTVSTVKAINPDSLSFGHNESGNELFAFYVDSADNTLLRWKTASSPCNGCSWGTEQTVDDGTEAIDWLSAGRKDWPGAGADNMPVTYTNQTSQIVRWVNAPEFLWLFFVLAPFLPILLKRLKGKRSFNYF